MWKTALDLAVPIGGINQEHRIVYNVIEERKRVEILSLKGSYLLCFNLNQALKESNENKRANSHHI